MDYGLKFSKTGRYRLRHPDSRRIISALIAETSSVRPVIIAYKSIKEERHR